MQQRISLPAPVRPTLEWGWILTSLPAIFSGETMQTHRASPAGDGSAVIFRDTRTSPDFAPTRSCVWRAEAIRFAELWSTAFGR